MSQAFDSFQQPQSTSEKWVAISDREKGLVTGIENVLPRIEHLHCCQHIADNIYARYGKDCKKLWWPIARVKDPYQREAAIDRLKEKDLKAWQYVKALNTETFSFYYINANSYSRFGHDTSNIVECINSIWGEYRDMPPLMMLDCIYTWTMRRFAKRQSLKAISQTLSNGPYKKFKERMVEAQKYIVTPAGNQVFQVDTPRRHRRRVDLDKHICSCLNFKEYQSPCSHAIACCLYDQDDPFKLFHHGYTLQVYRDTYRHTIQLVLRSMIFGQISTLNLHRFSSFVDGHTPNGSENINGKLRFISVELVTKLAITNVHAGTNQLQMVELSVFKSGNLILTMTPTATLNLTSLIIMIGLTMSTTNLTSKALPLSNEIGLLRIVEIASLLAWLKRQALLMMKIKLRVQIRKQMD